MCVCLPKERKKKEREKCVMLQKTEMIKIAGARAADCESSKKKTSKGMGSAGRDGRGRTGAVACRGGLSLLLSPGGHSYANAMQGCHVLL